MPDSFPELPPPPGNRQAGTVSSVLCLKWALPRVWEGLLSLAARKEAGWAGSDREEAEESPAAGVPKPTRKKCQINPQLLSRIPLMAQEPTYSHDAVP